MSRPRDRLAAQAAAAGYPTGLLTTVAEAALPRHRAGERLDDGQIEQVTAAVETLAQAGVSAQQLPGLIAGHRRRHGEHWRARLWEQVLRTANARHAHTDRHRETGAQPAPDGPPPAMPGRAA